MSSISAGSTKAALQDVSNQSSNAAVAAAAATAKNKTKTNNSEVTVPRDLLDSFIKYGMGDGIMSSKEAKQEYFLTTQDLWNVRYQSIGGGIGCGAPMKIYKHDDLIEVALATHGRSGLEQKLQARYKRQAKKEQREREADAKLAAQEQKAAAAAAASTSSAAATATSSTTNAAPPEESKDLKKLRASLLKFAKKKMGFERSGSPKSWRVEIPNTSAATFAALMGRPQDDQLETFCKKGAYYTMEYYSTHSFFGVCPDTDITKYFGREGVSQRIADTITVRYKPSANELSISGWAEMWHE